MALIANYGCQDNAATTTVVDRSGNNYHGTAARNTSEFTYGNSPCGARSLLFNGTTDLVALPTDFIGTGDVSLSFWVYFNSAGGGGYGRLFDNGKFILYYNGTVVQVYSNGATALSSNVGLTALPGPWYHIIVTRASNGTGTIYINGTQRGTGSTGTPASGTTALTLGNKADGSRGLAGYLTDVRAYNHILGATEIADLFADTAGDEIAVSDSNIVWSPYNWYTGTYAHANTPGAYVKIGTAGPTLGLVFDVSALRAAGINASYYPQYRYSLDHAAWTTARQSSAANMQTLLPGTQLSAGGELLMLLEAIDPYSPAADIWTTITYYFRILRFLVAPGGATAAVTTSLAEKSNNIMVLGDSLVESVGALGGGYIGGMSALTGLPWLLGMAFDAEVGALGYGSQGEGQAGTVGVPKVWVNDGTGSWGNYYAGASRLTAGLFVPQPDMIFDCHGIADHTGSAADEDVQAGCVGLLAAQRGAAPNAWIFRVIPPGGWKRTAITAGFNAYQAATPDAKCKLLDLGTAFQDGLDDNGASRQSNDGFHPYRQVYAEWAAQLVTAARDAMKVIPRRARMVGV